MSTNQLSTNSSLVQVQGSQVITTSLLIARKFNKRHADVVRTVKSLILANAKLRSLYESDTYVDLQGKSRTMFTMNKDGFVLLVMGFTGEQALSFKLDYINAFNAMEQTLKTPTTNEREIMLGMKTYFDKLRTQTVRLTKELQQQYGVTVGLNDLCYSYSIDLNRSLAENIKALLPATHNTLIAGWYAAYDAERNRKKAKEAFRMRNLLASFASHIEGLGIRSIEEW